MTEFNDKLKAKEEKKWEKRRQPWMGENGVGERVIVEIGIEREAQLKLQLLMQIFVCKYYEFLIVLIFDFKKFNFLLKTN